MLAPVLVLNSATKRESGRKAQLGNIQAAKTVADVVRTSLGPSSMLKMILSFSGGIVLTNDGNAILRELDVTHPSAKAMIDLSRAQDEEVGDGTTSVIVLAGEILSMVEPWLVKGMQPKTIIRGLHRALEDSLAHARNIAIPVDLKNRSEILQVVRNCIGTKFATTFYPPFLSELALDAVMIISQGQDGGRRGVDIKRYVRIEKIPGGLNEDCRLVPGVVLNKDVTHPSMRRRIENPRIVVLDCNLEYKKGENQTTIDVSKPEQWQIILEQEEEYVRQMVENIVRVKPDLVLTEKGVSDLAQHYFVKHNITALRRIKKTDSDRLVSACGAQIVHQTENIKESDVGIRALLFEVQKIGDEYYSFITCSQPKACTILLRGSGKDLLNEIERNLQDALYVARNVICEPLLLPGGGATEMSISSMLTEKCKSIPDVIQFPYNSMALSLEVIPRTLIQNSGASVVRNLTALRVKHTQKENTNWGIDGITGAVVDVVKDLNLLESYSVKVQTFKTAVEAACMLLRVDQIVSGITKKDANGHSKPQMDTQDESALPPNDF